MLRLWFILVGMVLALSLVAQKSLPPCRTAEDIAHKQTAMLVRELHITDSVLCDTLFRMHLKYAMLHNISHTRNEAIQRMVQMQEELKNILSPEQYSAFMNRQLNHTPRSPQHPCNWLTPHQHATPHPTPEGLDTLPPPPAHQQ